MAITTGPGQRALLLALLATTACAGRFDASPASFTLSDDAPVELDAHWCQELIFVEVMLGEAGPFELLLDTGAQSTVLDDDVLAEAGLELRRSRRTLTGSGGKRLAIEGLASIERMSVAGLDGRSWVIEDFDVNVLELEIFEFYFGRRFDGILGYSAFLGLTLELDYLAHRVSVLPTRLEQDTPVPAGVGRFTHARATRPYIGAELEGEPVELLLDTGYLGQISLGGLDQRPLLAGPALTGASRGVDGLRTSSSARLDGDVVLGPVVLADPIATEDPKHAKLGVQFMRRFVWRLDPDRQLVELESRISEPITAESLVSPGFVGDMVPAEVEGLERALEVLALLPDSPAARDGLEVGDLVVRVDGVPIPGMCAQPSSPRGPGEALTFEVLRAGETLEIATETFAVIE